MLLVTIKNMEEAYVSVVILMLASLSLTLTCQDDGSLVTDVQEAANILAKARVRLDSSDTKLAAEVFLAEGIVSSVMGITGQFHSACLSCLFHEIFADYFMLL
jgi:hypothetical protein